MPQNFLACDREQSFLLPPDVREWLPENHLAWFVIDTVAGMDTAAFYAAYRDDGHGRAAYEPSVMLALLRYCWARGTRSSRAIERACGEDVACRVITASQRPVHATIVRFVERHERALAAVFGEVLALCAEPGLPTIGVIAIDGTKVVANANRDRAMDYEQIARGDRRRGRCHRRHGDRCLGRSARQRVAGNPHDRLATRRAPAGARRPTSPAAASRWPSWRCSPTKTASRNPLAPTAR